MDPRLLSFYTRELQHVREMGGEFAKEFPKIAGRLGLDEFECADPYVERLLESFAFLTARLQLRMDAQFPRVSQHLLGLLYPHYLAPTPSLAVVQIEPAKDQGALAGGFKIPRGSVMRSLLGRGDQTSCEYRTSQEVTLWPIEFDRAEYSSFVGDLGNLSLPTRKVVRSALRLQLRSGGGVNLKQLDLDKLPVFLRGDGDIPQRLYEQLMANTIAVIFRPLNPTTPSWTEVISDHPITSLGYEDNEALLPYGHRSFNGYRLLQEYFAMPARFLFAQLTGLKRALARSEGNGLEVIVLFEKADATLENAVSANNFALYCTPAANIFPRRADRIHLSDRQHEYQVLPDRTRPMDYEVFSITDVEGLGSNASERRDFRPLYATRDGESGQEQESYFTIRREPRMLSSRQQTFGARSSYVGSEVFLSLVDRNEGPFAHDLKQLSVGILCSNRDLPLHMPIGQGTTDFNLESSAPIRGIRCVAGPTAPHASFAHGDTTWRLVSHLSLNYLSLVGENARDGSTIRELLSLYADLTDTATRKQIEGVVGLSSKPITRRLPIEGPLTFGRGLEISLVMNEIAFQGAGAYLLGSVLNRFFSKYVAINSFVETSLSTVQRGEVARWPTQLGLRHII